MDTFDMNEFFDDDSSEGHLSDEEEEQSAKPPTQPAPEERLKEPVRKPAERPRKTTRRSKRTEADTDTDRLFLSNVYGNAADPIHQTIQCCINPMSDSMLYSMHAYGKPPKDLFAPLGKCMFCRQEYSGPRVYVPRYDYAAKLWYFYGTFCSVPHVTQWVIEHPAYDTQVVLTAIAKMGAEIYGLKEPVPAAVPSVLLDAEDVCSRKEVVRIREPPFVMHHMIVETCLRDNARPQHPYGNLSTQSSSSMDPPRAPTTDDQPALFDEFLKKRKAPTETPRSKALSALTKPKKSRRKKDAPEEV